jgi:hypothetical protein
MVGCGSSGSTGYREIPPDEVIRRHIQFLNEKNKDAAESCMVKERRNQIDWQFDSQKSIRIIDMKEEKDSAFVYSYMKTGRGSITHPAKVSVYKVSLERQFNEYTGMEDINFWHYFVVKQTEDSPWLIDDWGI